MNYIVFDLEFNQSITSINKSKICPFEIIQIGAFKMDQNLSVVSKFNRFVKPSIYKELHPFIKEMTKITQDQLSKAKSFNEVFEEFIEFIGDANTILCVWGMTDLKEIHRNIQFHELDHSKVPVEYYNIQNYASRHLKCAQGINIGLSNAVDALGISISGDFHNAFNDALYTAEIFKRTHKKRRKPKIYDYHEALKSKRIPHKKTRIDTEALIKQFEKMFEREISSEEAFMIKLAYMMGKSGQFQVEVE